MGHTGLPLLRRRRRSASLPSIEYFPGNFLYFKSTKLAFDQLWGAIQDDETHIIGLYGMGGSGKTTLVVEVGRKAKQSNLFERVVFVTASNSPNITKMQGEMAEMLDLQLKEESEEVRAQRLWLTLKEKRVLIILDDVWAKLRLEDIGIVVPQKNCKVLLNSRHLSACTLMDCHKKFPLYLLSEDEAWIHFQRRAGIDENCTYNALEAVARDVVKELKGLLTAIEVVGGCLKGKSIEEWKAALHILRRNSIRLDAFKDIRGVYNSVRLNYEHLKGAEAKTLLLMCTIFPEDREFLIEDLFRFTIRLGLFQGVDSGTARTQLNAAIKTLIAYCWLFPGTCEDRLMMHNLARDVGLWIATVENRTDILNLEKELNALADSKMSQVAGTITSWYEELVQLHQWDVSDLHSPSSSTTNAKFSIEGGFAAQPLKATEAVTIAKPSGEMVDFHGLCSVDKSFLPLLEKACGRMPHLIECQMGRSSKFRECAFESLGQVLFLLHNVRIKDLVHHRDELQMYWEQAKDMKFNLEWLSAVVERVLCSAEIGRIGALQEEVKNLSAEADRLRQLLRLTDDKISGAQKEISLIESKLDSFAVEDDV